jgi:hypothetical protein
MPPPRRRQVARQAAPDAGSVSVEDLDHPGACEAFVRSQTGEGWRLIKTAYDDGGFSSGSMERPALQRLLDDTRSPASIRFLPRELLRSLYLARAHGFPIACGRTIALLEAGAAAHVPPRQERRSEIVAATVPADQLLALRLGCCGLFPGGS